MNSTSAEPKRSKALPEPDCTGSIATGPAPEKPSLSCPGWQALQKQSSVESGRAFAVQPEAADFLLKSYDFLLPEESIAQHPPRVRGSSRLMVMERENSSINHAMFGDLARWLPEGALLVANNTRVLPSRIFGKRDATGGRLEFLLLTPLPLLEARKSEQESKVGRQSVMAEGLVRSGGKLREGELLTLDGGINATLLEKGPFGRYQVRLEWQGNLFDAFIRCGEMPLPPYIRRPCASEDAERYQTIFARADKTGAAAAPTAGLHFTPQLHKTLADHGFAWHEITLYVGYGTFSPVRCNDIREHEIHSEYMEIPEDTAQAVQQAKAEGRPVAAVGTTSARALEGVAAKYGEVRPFAGWTDIFLYPGRPFRIIDALLTNFHLPKSSLLMLVSAFGGRKRMLDAYAEAVNCGYRFFSYGDAMLIR